MGIFGGKKEEEKKKDAPKQEKGAAESMPVLETGIVPATVLRKAHITEKALLAGSRNVYVFEIFPRATKQDVKRAVEAAYNVNVIDVNVAKVPKKRTSRRVAGRQGTKGGVKKAYVTLKEGDRLQLM